MPKNNKHKYSMFIRTNKNQKRPIFFKLNKQPFGIAVDEEEVTEKASGN